MGAGRVVLGGAPLGSSADASQRLRDALGSMPVIAAEDTRRLRRLCSDLGVTPSGRIVSFFEANESQRVPQLIEALQAGDDVLVVTDAGMPSVSDPGYRLVAAAIEVGIEVTALPGPSAVTTAVAISGLPVDRFCFEGFVPRKAGERRRALAQLAEERRTLVFFESPHRVHATLVDLADAFGEDRRAAVCRELTKTYEQVVRGTLAELVTWAEGDVRGEITLVIEGSKAYIAELKATVMVTAVRLREEAGQTRKEAIAAVAQTSGVPKRVVFEAVVQAKNDSNTTRGPG